MTSPPRNQKATKTITKTIKKTDPTFSLKKKLTACNLEVKNYVRALETENFKLAAQNGKLQAENMTLNNRVKALTEQIKEQGPSFAELIRGTSQHKTSKRENLKA